MIEKKVVTYYLGAGASVGAVPAVQGFNSGLEFFIDYLERVAKTSKDKKVEELHDAIKEFSIYFKGQFSPDTLARKFSIKNEKFYEYTKKIIALYLLFEQSKCKNEDEVLLAFKNIH